MEEATNRRILNGWKQISHHIERGVRTAQRWEALLGMPVYRSALKDRGAVVAFSDELESWLSRTSPEERNECGETDERVTNVNEWNERLLRVFDNMSSLVRQSQSLLSQVQTLQEQLRRSRKSRRVASRTIAPDSVSTCLPRHAGALVRCSLLHAANMDRGSSARSSPAFSMGPVSDDGKLRDGIPYAEDNLARSACRTCVQHLAGTQITSSPGISRRQASNVGRGHPKHRLGL
jgi:hypothetical protein